MLGKIWPASREDIGFSDHKVLQPLSHMSEASDDRIYVQEERNIEPVVGPLPKPKASHCFGPTDFPSGQVTSHCLVSNCEGLGTSL